MSRKSGLMQFLNQRYQHHREGNPLLRKRRFAVMCGVTDDLANIKQLPKSWYSLTEENIRNLVGHWVNQAINNSTIMNRLSVLRHFYTCIQLSHIVPSNVALNIKKLHNNNASDLSFKLLDHINLPIIKIILGFEIHFGMRKKEILKLISNLNIFTAYIHVSRNIAFNGKERHLPIITTEQKKIITEWNQHVPVDTSLLQIYSYYTLIEMYQYELKRLSLKSNVYHRTHYIKTRYHQLSQEKPKHVALAHIQQELGLSNRHVRRYLHE
jgi:hypothetical protein